jgi:hypothetical protein
MGIVDDILKGLPINPILREQVSQLNARKAAAETENAILKDDLRNANTKIKNLEKQIEKLTHVDNLDEIDVQILLYIANAEYSDPWAEVIAEDLKLHLQVAEYRLSTLVNVGYIIQLLELGGDTVYKMHDKGRRYLIETKLLS